VVGPELFLWHQCIDQVSLNDAAEQSGTSTTLCGLAPASHRLMMIKVNKGGTAHHGIRIVIDT
jgi:hypothetical protein